MTLAFQISDHTLTFYAKGRPWTIASDAQNFATIREGLLTSALDAVQLVELADVKESIKAASPEGLLKFVGDALQYKDQALANVWVSKILLFRKEGLPFDSVFNALESLLRNPSFQARERLPIFVERSRLGFLADGRIAAFKVIGHDWKDINSGTFDNSVGKIVSMPREDVDDDPDHACSYGLHVGALEYIPSFGLYDSDKRVVLVAVKAEDFVAVPKDYNGSKARVSSYEVLEEVDKEFIKEFVENNQTVVRPSTWSEEIEESTFDRLARVIEELSDNFFDVEESQSLADLDLEGCVGVVERALEEEFSVAGLAFRANSTIAEIASIIDAKLIRQAA